MGLIERIEKRAKELDWQCRPDRHPTLRQYDDRELFEEAALKLRDNKAYFDNRGLHSD